ncbi:MAG: 2-hydroxyacyl-CoA dehydratase [Blautia sp.]|nr:2-hydroxyacyl-CoA dehydratase [Blautia sp.]
MGIRECARKNPAFQALLEAYTHREDAASAFRSSGGKVIGELGCDVPDELIIAAGMLPVRIYADPEKPLKETDRYLEYAFDPVVRSQFEKIVDGTCYDQIDHLVISNSTDVVIRIFLYLREMHRVEPEKHVPPVEFIDWLFTRNRLHQVRNEHTIGLFKEAVESWAGRSISDEEIRRAAEICNADRQALRRISALRTGKEVRVSGCEALVIIGSAFFMERQEHTRLVGEVAADAAEWPVLDGPRVFFTGSDQEDLSVYERIEDTGLVIVGEDHNWGDRFFDRDYNMAYTPVRAIVDCYMLREFSSKKAFVSQRVEALDRWVERTGAQAVIFYTNRYEEAASWDYPSQKKSLEERGIRTVNFAKMSYPVSANPDFPEKIQAFSEMLKNEITGKEAH